MQWILSGSSVIFERLAGKVEEKSMLVGKRIQVGSHSIMAKQFVRHPLVCDFVWNKWI